MPKKTYSETFTTTPTGLVSKKRPGQGLEKDLRNQCLALARKEFQAALQKYGTKARKAGLQNLKTSLALFQGGLLWIQDAEEEEVYDDSGMETVGTGHCAIGAIHSANGQGEHLARLAADLAAGELFPKRAMDFDSFLEEEDEDGNATWDGTLPDVVSFNDTPETKFKDVKRVFERAIELLGV